METWQVYNMQLGAAQANAESVIDSRFRPQLTQFPWHPTITLLLSRPDKRNRKFPYFKLDHAYLDFTSAPLTHCYCCH